MSAKHGKTMYATTDVDALTSGRGIDILAEFNEPATRVDKVACSGDMFTGVVTEKDVYDALNAAGYRRVGSTTHAANGLIIPVAKVESTTPENPAMVQIETQVGMHGLPRLYLRVFDEDRRVLIDVTLTGDDVLRLVTGGSVHCKNRRPVKSGPTE